MAERDIPTAQDYADIFDTDRRGARILEHMISKFERPAVVKGGIDAVLQTYVRMGQRNVLDFINNQIAVANGVIVVKGE